MVRSTVGKHAMPRSKVALPSWRLSSFGTRGIKTTNTLGAARSRSIYASIGRYRLDLAEFSISTSKLDQHINEEPHAQTREVHTPRGKAPSLHPCGLICFAKIKLHTTKRGMCKLATRKDDFTWAQNASHCSRVRCLARIAPSKTD